MISYASAWLAWGWRQVATVLRGAAEIVEGLADGLDGGAAPVRPAPKTPSVDDDSQPLSGTRERIAVTLDRARQRYDAVSGAPPRSGKRRSR